MSAIDDGLGGRLKPAEPDSLTGHGVGAAGVFEIAVLTGIYHTVCGIPNAFDIPAP